MGAGVVIDEMTIEELKHIGWTTKDLNTDQITVRGQNLILSLNGVEIARAWREDDLWSQARLIESARTRHIYNWQQALDERQKLEIQFAQVYSRDFSHGTDGHHRLLLIAKLAGMLGSLTQIYKERGINDGNLSD